MKNKMQLTLTSHPTLVETTQHRNHIQMKGFSDTDSRDRQKNLNEEGIVISTTDWGETRSTKSCTFYLLPSRASLQKDLFYLLFFFISSYYDYYYYQFAIFCIAYRSFFGELEEVGGEGSKSPPPSPPNSLPVSVSYHYEDVFVSFKI